MASDKSVTTNTDLPGAESEKVVMKVAKELKSAAKSAPAKKQAKTLPAALVRRRKDQAAATKPAAAKPKAAAKARHAEPAEKAKKDKLVRDSFTMPESEYALLSQLKKRCLAKGVAAKKSEILRAAIASLADASDASVLKAVKRLNVIKTGRPAKGKA
jgi:G3E family GTPase